MALQQVEDLRAEGDALHQFLETLEDHHWEMQTPFKDRTVNGVVQHLHDAIGGQSIPSPIPTGSAPG